MNNIFVMYELLQKKHIHLLYFYLLKVLSFINTIHEQIQLLI